MKINCVPMGPEEQKIEELAELARKYPVHVRFIEMMPVGLGKEFRGVSEAEILEQLRRRFGRKKRSGVGWETGRRTTIPFRDFRERSVLSAP